MAAIPPVPPGSGTSASMDGLVGKSPRPSTALQIYHVGRRRSTAVKFAAGIHDLQGIKRTELAGAAHEQRVQTDPLTSSPCAGLASRCFQAAPVKSRTSTRCSSLMADLPR